MQKKQECNLCGSKSIKNLYFLQNINLMNCAECGLVFREMMFDNTEVADLYSEGYFTIKQKDYFFNKAKEKQAIFRERIKNIEDLYPPKGVLLDIGCAVGTFLVTARECGWQVKGVEVSEYASDYARTHYGLDVATGHLEQQNFKAESFDVITLWDVIDHVEKPQQFLNYVYMLLKPGGLLVVQTTMEDSLLYRAAHYMYLLSAGYVKKPVARCHPIHHSTFYSTSTVKVAMEKAGFSIIKQIPDDLNPELINTNFVTKKLLKIFSLLAQIVGRPLESIFYAKK